MTDLDDTQPTRRAAVDPLAETQPTAVKDRPEYLSDPLSDYQPIRLEPAPGASRPGRKSGPRRGRGCLLPLLLILALLIGYFIFPIRTNIVLLGIDDRTPGEAMGRSDTLILLSLKPVERYVGMVSIPRDLWVNIPGVGENRINTAHFFAEIEQPGSGPEAVKTVIQANFGVKVPYYIRARFDNFKQVITALGGVRITLAEPMGGYPAGTHLLDADQALAFVRDRTSGGDDFARMRQTQVLGSGLIETALTPANFARWPEMAGMALSAVETDIPAYWWPRLGLAVLLSMPDGIDGRVIGREMVSPFTTDQGGQVLAPRWELIRPMILEVFGE